MESWRRCLSALPTGLSQTIVRPPHRLARAPRGAIQTEGSGFQSFYLSRRWLPWAFPGAVLILFVTWYKVELDVKINDWFGDFYNLVQKALSQPTTITMEYMRDLATFGYIAGLYVTIAVFTDFYI